MKQVKRPRKPAAVERPASTAARQAAPTLDQSSLQRLIGYNLRRAEVQMRGMVAAVLGQDDIRAVEYSILSLVAGNHEVTQKDLGHALSVKRPNMVSLIERLEKRGLIVRSVLARDRRNQILSLTPSARSLLARLHARLDALESELFDSWSPGERRQIAALLQRLYLD